MKKQRRIFCLLIIAALALSLTAPAVASVTDEDLVKYPTAIDILTATGVVEGYDSGKLLPSKKMTREEAAKLVVFSTLGPDAAGKLTNSKTGFTDTPVDSWSAPYISWLMEKNVVSGRGDGTFDPKGLITGYELAKMLLTSTGYGAKGEFDGPGWDLKVAAAGRELEIFAVARDSGDFSRAVNREEAMLVDFNCITRINTVSYDANLGVYVPITDAAGSPVTIAKKVFPSLVNQGSFWTLDGKIISGEPIYFPPVPTTRVLATSHDGTAYANLTDSKNNRYIGYAPETSVEYRLNGDVKTSAATGLAGKRGVKLEFVDTNGNDRYDQVCITMENITQLTGNPVVQPTDGITKVTLPGIVDAPTPAANVRGYEGLKKDDFVRWYKNDAGVTNVVKCESITGVVSSVQNESVTMTDDKVYKLSQLVDIGDSHMTALINLEGYTFYLDGCGYIAGYKAPTVSLSNLLFVLSAEKSQNNVTKATLLFSNGTTAVDATIASAPAGESLKDKFFSYTVSDGEYSLHRVGNQATVSATDASNDGDTSLAVGDIKYIYAPAVNSPLKYYTAVAGTDSGVSWPKTATGIVDAGVLTNATVFAYQSADSLAFTPVAGLPKGFTYTIDKSGSCIYYIKDAQGYLLWAVGLGGRAETPAAS